MGSMARLGVCGAMGLSGGFWRRSRGHRLQSLKPVQGFTLIELMVNDASGCGVSSHRGRLKPLEEGQGIKSPVPHSLVMHARKVLGGGDEFATHLHGVGHGLAALVQCREH